MRLDNSSLHHAIVRHFVDRQHAPSIDQLAAYFGEPREAVIAGLKALQEYHGVVLHPASSEVWVQSAKGSWWANCAWCATGIAALVDGEATFTTTLGGEAHRATVHIEDGKLLDDNLLVHFPIPMRKVWENVIYTCSTILLFDSEARIDDWCHRHRIPKGDVQPLSRVWEMSRVWYGQHLSPDWKKWSGEEARAIFEKFGLTSPTWDVPTSAARF